MFETNLDVAGIKLVQGISISDFTVRARSALALVSLTKTPINHTFFESLIITDYNKFYLNG